MFHLLLIAIVLFLSIVVFCRFLNEKTINLPVEIALLLSGLLISIVVLILQRVGIVQTVGEALPDYLLDEFLVKGVLCFMLFAGACNLRFCDLKSQIRLVSCLSLLSTIVASFLYGAIMYGIGCLLGLSSMNFSYCLLLGCIISPTDPIAAMSILKKVGLPEDVALAIEGESLFNDGVGVALFVVVSSSIQGTSGGGGLFNFVVLLGKELLGAMVIGLLISLILYQLFLRTKDQYLQLFISILAVSASYVISESAGCSSAIAAVVCGIFFATFMDKQEQKNPEQFFLYRNFWSVIDSLLNSILYVMLGMTFINICIYTKNNVIWIIIALIGNVLARYRGVLATSLCVKEKPQDYGVLQFTGLLTWAGLKGALCLALAMQTHSFLPQEVFQTIMICTFAVVMFTTLGQGLTIGKFYKARFLK